MQTSMSPLRNLNFLKYMFDTTMYFTELEIIVIKTIAENFVNEFCKNHSIHMAARKLESMFLVPGITQGWTRQLNAKLRSLKYKGVLKGSNF